MNGVSLPKTITELGKTKKLTLFIDGDRGGILIAKDALENSKIAFVAQAPSGMEVEELTGKEILASLRNKVPAEEFAREKASSKGRYERTPRGRGRYSRREDETAAPAAPFEKKEITGEEAEKMQKVMKDIEGTKTAVLLDEKMELV